MAASYVNSVREGSQFATMAKERALNLFDALGKISTKQRKYYETLSEEERKEFLPVVLMRWLSGTSDARQIYFINEIVNPFVYSLHKHKELLAALMSVSTSGVSQRYSWLKANSKKSTNTPVIVELIKEYYRYTTSQAIDVLPLLEEADILGYASELGRQPDEIAKIKKEMKLLHD